MFSFYSCVHNIISVGKRATVFVSFEFLITSLRLGEYDENMSTTVIRIIHTDSIFILALKQCIFIFKQTDPMHKYYYSEFTNY